MVDLSAIAKWPNVPACYGWLSLDRRGYWRLQGERITHSGLINFLNQQYGCDASGCWFVQNGPQRVFVNLAYTPWIFRQENTTFISHTNQAAGQIEAIHLDEEGNILLTTTSGIGLLDDRDLPHFLAQCHAGKQQAATEAAFLNFLEAGTGKLYWQNIPFQRISAVGVAKYGKFNPQPAPN